MDSTVNRGLYYRYSYILYIYCLILFIQAGFFPKNNPSRALALDSARNLYHVLDFLLEGGIGCTDKKENQIFLIYKKIQSGAVAKVIYEEGLP